MSQADREQALAAEDGIITELFVGAPAPELPYLNAEHVAQLRVANASRGVTHTAELVERGALPQSSLDAARAELESARAVLARVHQTPAGRQPSRAVLRAVYGGKPPAMPQTRRPVRTVVLDWLEAVVNDTRRWHFWSGLVSGLAGIALYLAAAAGAANLLWWLWSHAPAEMTRGIPGQVPLGVAFMLGVVLSGVYTDIARAFSGAARRRLQRWLNG